jgi:beta-lactamase regulating signal transducer with metallopeptidase domain
MIGWAIETALAMSALLALVLLLRKPVANAFGAGWAYALWLLPALRLIMPPVELVSADLAETLPPIAIAISGPELAASPAVQDGGAGLANALLTLWAIGALAFVLWQALRYRGFVRQMEATLRPAYPDAFEGLPLAESRGVDGPIAIGLLQPRIVLPYDFLSRYEPAEQALALRHEWIHHRRGDLWWNLLALGLLALHWFNPLAWIAFRAFRADQELACDAAVLADAPGPLRHAYGLALVKSASRPGLLAACPLNSADQLKRRLRMLKSHRHSTMRSLAGGLIVAGTFGTALCLSAPTLAQEAKAGPVKERRIFVREIGKEGSRELPADIRELAAKCPEAQRLESDVKVGEAGKDEHRTRIIMCRKDGTAGGPETREKMIAALERARSNMADAKELSPERRTQVLDALTREIERVRSGSK